jgi:hypothetical protein
LLLALILTRLGAKKGFMLVLGIPLFAAKSLQKIHKTTELRKNQQNEKNRHICNATFHFWVIFGHFWVIFGSFLGHFWSFLVIFGSLCLI